MFVSHRYRILAVLIVCLFLIQLDTMLLTVAAGQLMQPAPTGLGLTQGELLWVSSAYTLALTGTLLVVGWLGDRYGRRRLLLVGMGVFAGASALSSFASEPWQLIAGRAVLGIAAACVSPNTLATLVSVFDGPERGRAIGLWSAAVGVALAAGPIIAGALLSVYRWPSLFWINVPVAVVAIGGLVLWVPESRRDHSGGVDLAGMGLSTAGMGLLIQGILSGGDSGRWLTVPTGGCILAGLLVLAGFVGWELRTPHPMLKLSWFAIGRLRRSVLMTAVGFMAMSGVMFPNALWFLVYRGFSPLLTGVLMLPLALGQFLFAPLGQPLVSRWGPRIVGSVGAALLTASLATFALQPAYGILPAEVGMFGVGVALALILPTATVEIQSSVPPSEAGMASAVNNLFRQLGATVGGAVVGSVLAARYRGWIGSGFDMLPGAARDAATQSLQACYVVLSQLPAVGPAHALRPHLKAIADAAFVSGYRLGIWVGVAMAAVSVGAALGLPGRAAKEINAPVADSEPTVASPA